MTAAYLALLFSALAFAISVFSFFYFRRYLKRRTGQERILSELREEVNNIVRSIDEAADRDISLVEEREKALKSLLANVDKRLRLYIREMETRREAEDKHVALTTKTQSPTYQEMGKSRYRLSPPDAAPAHDPVAADNSGGGETSAVSAAPLGEQIRELMRAGFAPPVIASRMGVSIAEVEFAAALMGRRDNA